MPTPTYNNAAATSGTLGPGGRGGGPRRLEKLLLLAIIIEAALLFYLSLNEQAKIAQGDVVGRKGL